MKGQFLISCRINPLLRAGLFVIMGVLAVVSCKQKNSTTVEQIPPIDKETSTTNVDTQSPETMLADTFLYYKRTPCFGMCPIFEMTILENGEVSYSGKNFTNLIGEYRTQLDKTTLQNIVAKAESIGYFRMSNVYDNEGVTDLPSIYVAIRKDTKLKWVKNRYNGPKELKVLYEYLDKVIEEAKWEAVK